VPQRLPRSVVDLSDGCGEVFGLCSRIDNGTGRCRQVSDSVLHSCTLGKVEVVWSDAAAEHLARSQRYPDAVDIALEWTVEAVNDSDAVQVDPYWTSRVNALAIIGNSEGAGAVLVVLAYRDLDGDLHGMTAWPATGRAFRLYTDGRTS
jgi:hypothetical protein